MNRALPIVSRVAGIGLVLVLVAAFYSGPGTLDLEANSDSLRDLWRTWMMLDKGELPVRGPTISFLPIELGPGWYYLTAPALLIDPSPWSAWINHLVLFALGLTALWCALGRGAGSWWGATLTVLFLASSQYALTTLDRLWHTAALPGLGLLWIGALFAAVEGRTPGRRAAGLVGLWVAQIALLQTHLIGGAYALLTGLVQLAHWRDWFRYARGELTGRVTAPARALTGLASALAVAVVGFYGWQVLSVDWGAAFESRESAGGERTPVGEGLQVMMSLLRNGWTWPPLEGLPWVALLLAGAGIGVALRRSPRRTWARWLALHVALALPFVLLVVRGGAFPRYFSGVVPSVYALAGVGLCSALRWVRSRIPDTAYHPAMVVTLLLAVQLSASNLYVSGERPPRDVSTLSLKEQLAAVDVLHEEYGANLHTFRRRVHGPLMWDTVALYAALLKEERPASLGYQSHLTLIPDTLPPPSTWQRRLAIEVGTGRELMAFEHPPRFDYDRVVAWVEGQRCHFILPYVWGPHPSPEELRLFNLYPTPNPAECRPGGRPGAATLTVQVGETRGEGPLTVLLGWLDPRLVGGDAARVGARRLDGSPLALEPVTAKGLVRYRVYRLPDPPADGFYLDVSPVESLALVDVY